MVHEPVQVKHSPIHGLGVFAAEDLREGSRILHVDDSRVVTEENPLHKDEGEYERHCDYLAGGKVVLLQEPERYTNHSCDPNSFVKTVDGVRYRFALRDVAAGEEITNDYCVNSRGDTVWQCNCGSQRCRRTIHSDFFHLPLPLQLEYLPLLDDWFVDENSEKVEGLMSLAYREEKG